jgi:hypothetical protein
MAINPFKKIEKQQKKAAAAKPKPKSKPKSQPIDWSKRLKEQAAAKKKAAAPKKSAAAKPTRPTVKGVKSAAKPRKKKY